MGTKLACAGVLLILGVFIARSAAFSAVAGHPVLSAGRLHVVSRALRCRALSQVFFPRWRHAHGSCVGLGILQDP